MADIVRVLRILEYVGTRDWIERTLAQNAVHGELKTSNGTIREAILDRYPEVLIPEKRESENG